MQAELYLDCFLTCDHFHRKQPKVFYVAHLSHIWIRLHLAPGVIIAKKTLLDPQLYQAVLLQEQCCSAFFTPAPQGMKLADNSTGWSIMVSKNSSVLLKQTHKVFPRIYAVPKLALVVHLRAVAVAQAPECVAALLEPPPEKHELTHA